MTIEDLSFSDPEHNLARDEELLRLADREGAGEFLRFWESPVPFIVLGRTGVEADDVHRTAADLDRVPVLRRSSGGGTVVQGPGCLNFALVLCKTMRPDLQKITASYRYILKQVQGALLSLGVESEFRPICDLVLTANARKFSGNAQRRGRDHVLHHGTILYDFDLELITRYLKMPRVMPEHRQGRPHELFVTNIPVQTAAVKEALSKAFSA